MLNSLRRRVMARIYIEYTKNILVEKTGYYVPIIFLLSLVMIVSPPSIFHNMPKNDVQSTFNFFLVAIFNSGLIVKTIMSALVISLSIPAFKFIQKINFDYDRFFKFAKIS